MQWSAWLEKSHSNFDRWKHRRTIWKGKVCWVKNINTHAGGLKFLYHFWLKFFIRFANWVRANGIWFTTEWRKIICLSDGEISNGFRSQMNSIIFEKILGKPKIYSKLRRNTVIWQFQWIWPCSRGYGRLKTEKSETKSEQTTYVKNIIVIIIINKLIIIIIN